MAEASSGSETRNSRATESEGVIGCKAMVTPGISPCFRNESDALLEEGGGAGGKMQVECGFRWGDHAQKAWIQGGNFVNRGIDQIGDQAEVDGVVDGDCVGEDRGIVGDVVEAVLGGVVGNDDGGQDFGDVILGFAGKVVAFIKLPIVRVAGLLDGLLDAAGSPVVACHGEVPVAELIVDELHVAGVGAGGFFRVEALVDIRVLGQAVKTVVGHELPHATGPAAGPGSGTDGLGIETGFGDGEIDEVLGYALFGEDSLNHGLVSAGALKGMKEGVVSLLGFREELDECADVVVDDEGEIGLGGSELGAGLGDDVGIDLKGDIAGDVGGRRLLGGDEAVALLESFHFEGVDAVDDVDELILELGVGLDGNGAGEEEIDGAIELGFGLSELTLR